jgi:genome maintenance exonuclease 1
MKKNNSYRYPKTQREKVNGLRHYVFDTEKLPSVTTILDQTQTAEKRESLQRWRDRVGEAEATRIVDSAGARGTAMHKILEKYILEEGYVDQTTVGKQAHNMAIQVIQSGLSNVTEYYGTECTLYYPGLYAGQTDLVGIHKNQDAIIDFKQK